MRPTYTTISEAIANVGNDFPGQGYVFQDARGEETECSYAQMEVRTAGRAARMQELGLEQGDRIGLILHEPEDFILTFLAALRIGVVPVPLYPPLSFGSLDAYAERTTAVLSDARTKVLVGSNRLEAVLAPIVEAIDSLEHLVLADALHGATGTPRYPDIQPEDLAFLQYTSGSTAMPKGVKVTQASLVANARAIVLQRIHLDPARNDVGVSWLPLYHDMGLIGFVIAPMYFGVKVVFIPTMRFIKRPSVWLETIHRHRGTASFAPNFAFDVATRRVKEDDLARWDLSCLRTLGCGAEPIRPDTMRRFYETFSKCGLPDTAISPAYGMAEATLAIALKQEETPMQTLLSDSETFAESGTVVPPIDGRPTLEHVACGLPFSDHEVAVFGPDDQPVAEGTEGELCTRGPSITDGYFERPEATASAFRDGWLHTGDLGFMKDGQVYVTGRMKDLIIVNGRNIHPQAIEWSIAGLDGVRSGNVVAFSVPSPTGEAVVVAIETKLEDHTELIDEARRTIQRELSLAVADVVCLRPGTITKTSSGKLQRRRTHNRYLKGEFSAVSQRQSQTATQADQASTAGQR